MKKIQGNKYCEQCGEKGTTVPNGFDTKTGRQKKKYICGNRSCWLGEMEMLIEKQSTCSHVEGSFFFFPSEECRKCGKEWRVNSC